MITTHIVTVDYYGPIVSTNAAYKKTRWGSFYMSREGKEFKATLALAAQVEMRGQKRLPKTVPVAVTLDITFPTRRSDIDGPVKLILDAMNKVVWEDDKQVYDLTIRKHIAPKGGQTGVSLSAWASGEP